MNVIELGDTFSCDCGFSWKRGQSGSHNCDDGLRKQIADLQQKLDAVLAENVMLKNAVEGKLKLMDEISRAGRPPHADFWHQSIFMADQKLKDALVAPATDALLNAVRAEGVEMFAKHCDDSIGFIEPEDEDFYTLMEEQARTFAAQLRAETDTTHSQYESLAGGK